MKRLLIVDDDPDILTSLAMVLEETYEVTLAENGQEALDLALLGAFDAVVLDLMMPVLDGEGFLRELRTRGPVPPVILASAANDLAERARQLGVHEFLRKPFDIESLE